jgi:hypothetical protein
VPKIGAISELSCIHYLSDYVSEAQSDFSGEIHYYCEARLKINALKWFDHSTRTVFVVLPRLDLNTIPYITQPVSSRIYGQIGLMGLR